MGKDFWFDKYRHFAKYLTNKDHYILSGRYKFLTYKYKYIFKDISEKLSVNKFDDIFDIGTGDGKIIEYLSKKCKSATTIDSKEIIDSIDRKKNITYLKGNIHDEAKKIKKKFDKILVYSMVQYFSNLKEVTRFINLCLKLLKVSGAILIGDIPNEDMNLRYKKTKNYKKLSNTFEKKKMSNMSKLEKKFFFEKNQTKSIVFTDRKLFFLLRKFNTLKYEAYILPQNKELPYAVKRVDLLIKKKS